MTREKSRLYVQNSGEKRFLFSFRKKVKKGKLRNTGFFISQKGQKRKIAKRTASQFRGLDLLLLFLLFQPLVIHFLTDAADKGGYLVRERLRGDFAVKGVRLKDLEIRFEAAGSDDEADGGGGDFFESRYPLKADGRARADLFLSLFRDGEEVEALDALGKVAILAQQDLVHERRGRKARLYLIALLDPARAEIALALCRKVARGEGGVGVFGGIGAGYWRGKMRLDPLAERA